MFSIPLPPPESNASALPNSYQKCIQIDSLDSIYEVCYSVYIGYLIEQLPAETIYVTDVISIEVGNAFVLREMRSFCKTISRVVQVNNHAAALSFRISVISQTV